jgi:hypothetical protein
MLRLPGYEPESLLKDFKVASDYLKGLANKTGGRLFQADTQESLRQAFSSIAEDLRRQYSLGYYPRRANVPGQERKIKVSVNRSNVAVREETRQVTRKPDFAEMTKQHVSGIITLWRFRRSWPLTTHLP